MPTPFRLQLTRRGVLAASAVMLLGNPHQIARAADKPVVVATFSVLGDLVASVAGDAADVRTIVGAGVDTHTFAATPADAIALAVRVGAPLAADESVLAEAGIEIEETEDEGQGVDEGEVVEQFREFLDAVQPEDFAP